MESRTPASCSVLSTNTQTRFCYPPTRLKSLGKGRGVSFGPLSGDYWIR